MLRCAVSVSAPLDLMVAGQGYESRSQAIGAMIHTQLLEHKRQLGNEVMVGTITLLYDRSVRDPEGFWAEQAKRLLAEVLLPAGLFTPNGKLLHATPAAQAIIGRTTMLGAIGASMFAVLLAVSLLVGVMRGLLFEVLSLAGWVVAYLLAGFVAPWLLPLLPSAQSRM